MTGAELAVLADDELDGHETPEPVRSPASQRHDMSAFANFSFHQLVSLMELRQAGKPPVGTIGDPASEFMRFRATRSLSFGPADMSEVAWDEESDRLDVRVNFLGLYGPASPLPPNYTERIIEEDQTPDPIEDLFDLFNHRLISLFHVIWRKYRFYLRYERGGADPISKRFLALCGFPIEERTHIGQISRAALLPHVGLLSLYSSSADTTAAAISNFFEIPCRIEEFIERQIDIDPSEGSLFGASQSTLGEDIVLGGRLTDRLGKFRVCLGPAPYNVIAPFLPNGERHQALAEILSMLNREPLDWDIEFAFEPGTTPPSLLGDLQLGWTGWMTADPEMADNTIRVAPAVRFGPDDASGEGAGL
jgi:type VI secretion system protein ImpH